MMENLNLQTPKTRFLLLGMAILVSLLLIYQLSIKVTFLEFTRNRQLKDQIDLYNSQIANDKIQTREANFEYEIINLKEKHSSRNKLFEQINNIGTTQNIEIESFEDHSQFKDEEHIIETLKVEFSGTYTSLLKSLYEIEKQNLNYIISAARFIKVKNIKTKKNELILRLYFQTLLKNE